jgi:phosphate-selective porin OprO and OprP
LRENRVEYAVSVLDGARNSFQEFNNSKDVVAFLNLTPFRETDSVLKNLNVGGSVDYGVQNNPLNPAMLRTNANASSEVTGGTDPINNASIPFLAFNNDVRERGPRNLWELHLAYYYQGLSFITSWGSGSASYARRGAQPVKVPVEAFSVQAAYLITGETLNERTLIDPIHRFDLRPGKFGLGAFEPFARYSYMDIDPTVFTSGLADPNLWTHRLGLVDVGMNWYINRGVKVYLDWEHPMFAQPVLTNPGHFSRSNDIYWLRLQLYY